MKGIVRHNCGDHVEVTSEYLDIFFDMSDDTWYLKVEEPEYDVFESYGVSINYCPLCGVELSQYDEEILLAKQRYYEDKLSEIKYHLGRIRTTSLDYTNIDAGHPQKLTKGISLKDCEKFKCE